MKHLKPRLGINIDHVATIRQQRDEGYPSVTKAAEIAVLNGADQITIHLREDRRHIQDEDAFAVLNVVREHKKLLNFEMGCSKDILSIACSLRPDWVCLVPEKRQEKTTEGGLDLISEENFYRVSKTISILKQRDENIKISLFLECNSQSLKRASKIEGIDAVEIHTGEYAREILQGKNTQGYIDQFITGFEFLKSEGIACHAGHGLTKNSAISLLQLKIFAEYNIGHWVISQAVFDGLAQVIKDLKELFEQY